MLASYRRCTARLPFAKAAGIKDPQPSSSSSETEAATLSDWNWNRRTPKGLVANLLISLSLVIAADGLIFTLNPQAAGPEKPSFLDPPGWLVGGVWVLLFVAMASARWLVLEGDEGRVKSRTWIILLLLCCLAYPAYTLALQSLTLGLLGDCATFAAAVFVAIRVYRHSRLAAGLIACVALWVAFATLVTANQIWGHA